MDKTVTSTESDNFSAPIIVGYIVTSTEMDTYSVQSIAGYKINMDM